MVTDTMPRARTPFSLPLVRVAAGSHTRVRLLAGGSIFADTHWFGQQIMCAGDGCAACGVAPVRLLVYLGVSIERDGECLRPAMLEMTASSFGRLDGLARLEGEVRQEGMCVELSRKFAKSPMVAVPVFGAPAVRVPAFSSHLLVAAVAVLYRLPVPEAGEGADSWSSRVLASVERRVAELTK